MVARVSPASRAGLNDYSPFTIYYSLNKFQAAEEVGQLDLRVLLGVGAVDGVLADGVGELLAQRPLVGLGRVGRAHQVAPSLDGALLLKREHDARPRRHELRQLAEEGALAVDGVEALGLLPGQVDELHRAEAE